MFDTDCESSEEFEPAVITSIQKALSYLWNSYKYPFRVKTQTFTTRSEQDKYSLPNGNIHKKVVGSSDVYCIKYEKTFLEYLSDYELLEDKTGSPKGFFIKNDSLYIYPTPDDNYKISMEYLTTYPVLSEDGDSKATLTEETDYIDIPEKYEDLFVSAMLPLVQIYNIASDQDENFSAYKEQFEKAYKILIEFTQGLDVTKRIGW